MNRLQALTRVRSAARRLGILRLLSRLLARRSRNYEARFGAALASAIRPGDCVWDIGANVGYYTERFADLVGPTGQVVAFEPTPACFEQLSARLGGRTGVVLRREALGAREGVVAMRLASDPLGATHTLLHGARNDAEGATIEVPLRTGDGVLAAESWRVPTVVKVDVEGSEEDVVLGMRAILGNDACRAIFIEVHFALLEAKKTPDAPAHIVSELQQHGFRTRWLDPSHMMAWK